MHYDPANPLIVQGDRTVLLEVDNPLYTEARDCLAPFAELEKSPEHIHTYRLSNLSLWNAAAAGMSADAMIDVLRRYSKFPLPSNLATSQLPSKSIGPSSNWRLISRPPTTTLACSTSKTVIMRMRSRC